MAPPTLQRTLVAATSADTGPAAGERTPAVVQVVYAEADSEAPTATVNAVPVSGASPGAPMAQLAVSWQWQVNGNAWEAYSPEVSAKLEAAHAAGGSPELVDVDDTHTHYVDICALRQIRHDDKSRTRCVKRVLGAGQRLLSIADGVVADISDDEFNSKYKVATDHAEGERTIETVEAGRRKIQGMASRLPVPELISYAQEPPAQDVAAIISQLPVGMCSIVRGAIHPERMTPDAVWKDIRDHFGEDKTVPEQLADEKPTGRFSHSTAEQFEQAIRLMTTDLPNRPHLIATDYLQPLESAEAVAKLWQVHWQAGFDTLTELGGLVIGPTEGCLQTINSTMEQQYRKMEAERQLIEAATDELGRACTRVTELGDLSRKVKGDPNDDEALVELMAKYDFHDVGTARRRVIGEQKQAEQAVRQARKGLLDALQRAVGVNMDCIEAVRSLRPEFEATGTTAAKLARAKADEYHKKSEHIRRTLDRLASKKTEVGQQRREVQEERKQDAIKYAKEMEQSQLGNEADRKIILEALARIESRERRIRDATREDRESAWKEQVLVGTLDENERVLDACSAEISYAPEILDRCCKISRTMGDTAKQLTSELCENVKKDITRRESAGRDLDVRHFEEHTVARKKVFTEQLRTERMIFKCEQAIKVASDEMEDAAEDFDDDSYAEWEEKEAKSKEELARHQENITGILAEIDDLDKMIVSVVDRFQPLYTDPSLETAGKAQRTRIEATDAHAPWKRQDPAARSKVRGCMDVAGCAWVPVLPAHELERQVREVAAGRACKREREKLRRQQERADDEARFRAGLAPEIGNGAPGNKASKSVDE